MATSIFAIFIVIIGTIIGAFGSLFLKKGADKLSRNFVQMLLYNKSIFLGIMLYGISTLFFLNYS
jgi:Ca2+/Na+ antiporter